MQNSPEKKRITDIDAARGIAILCMLILHAFSFAGTFGGADVNWAPFILFIKKKGGVFFGIISGISATLGSRSVRRGLIVMGCGFLLTAVSVWLYKSGREGSYVLIQWGILHMIGFSMIVWPIFRKWPVLPLFLFAAAIIVTGYYLRENVTVHSEWLFAFGLKSPRFDAWDYQPILPHLGWFLFGAVLGKTLYPERRDLIFRKEPKGPLVRTLCRIGQNTLPIYLLHLPIYYLIAKLVSNA